MAIHLHADQLELFPNYVYIQKKEHMNTRMKHKIKIVRKSKSGYVYGMHLEVQAGWSTRLSLWWNNTVYLRERGLSSCHSSCAPSFALSLVPFLLPQSDSGPPTPPTSNAYIPFYHHFILSRLLYYKEKLHLGRFYKNESFPCVTERKKKGFPISAVDNMKYQKLSMMLWISKFLIFFFIITRSSSNLSQVPIFFFLLVTGNACSYFMLIML